MPMVEEPFDTLPIEYSGTSIQLLWIRVGYFTTSKRAPVMDIRINWVPEDENNETAVTVVLANPQKHNESVIETNLVGESVLSIENSGEMKAAIVLWVILNDGELGP